MDDERDARDLVDAVVAEGRLAESTRTIGWDSDWRYRSDRCLYPGAH